MAKATLLFSEKKVYADGMILQMTLWSVPVPVRGSTHAVKYSLFYGSRNGRIISYDNEAGKGDHVHHGDVERPYSYVSPERLVADFLAEVRALRGGSI